VRHALLSRIHRRIPVLPSLASAVQVSGDRSMTITRHGSFLLGPCVMVTLRLFFPCRGGNGGYGDRFAAEWIRASFRRRQGSLSLAWFELSVRCIYVFLCYYVQWGDATLVRVTGEGLAEISSFSYFLKPDLRSFVGFGETHAPQSHSSSSSGLAIACISRAGQR
jgi:hypothetical protein